MIRRRHGAVQPLGYYLRASRHGKSLIYFRVPPVAPEQ